MPLTLHTFLTPDGVLQAPGGPDQDTGGGFAPGPPGAAGRLPAAGQPGPHRRRAG